MSTGTMITSDDLRQTIKAWAADIQQLCEGGKNGKVIMSRAAILNSEAARLITLEDHEADCMR